MPLIKLFLLLLMLQLPLQANALDIPYAGFSYGSAKSSLPEQFDPASSLYVFFGIQKDYFITYEIGLSHFDFRTFEGQDQQRSATMLTGSVLAHLPIGDSSLFGRLGLSGYQYYDTNDDIQNVFVTTYGAGFDLALTRMVSLRMEWQRFEDLEYNQQMANIESWRAGLFFYF